MKKASTDMQHYRNNAWACVRCGICKMTNPEKIRGQKHADNCPSGTRFKFEPYYGSGKHELVRALTSFRPEIGIDETLLHVIYTCTQCGACGEICEPVKGINPYHASAALREHVVEEGFGPLPEHKTLIKSIMNYGNPWLSPRASRTRWTKKLGFKPKNVQKEKVSVLFYPGCTQALDPVVQEVAIATARLLQKAHVDFGMLWDKEYCCGSTVLRVGDRATFNTIKDYNMQMFKELDIDLMVTSCSGCNSILKEEYAEELPFPVIHTIEYIDQLIQEGKMKPSKKIASRKATYHDPCHLGRYTDVYDAPRRVIEAIPGIDFVEMDRIREYSWCCAAGGGVRTAFRNDLALWSADLRLEEAKETGADLLLTTCPFCEQNFKEAVAQKDYGIEIMDVLEVLDSTLE